MALDRVTSPTDSLEGAFRAVPLRRIATCVSGCHTEDGGPDYPTLVAVVRERIYSAEPVAHTTIAHAEGYRDAIADVARRLGL